MAQDAKAWTGIPWELLHDEQTAIFLQEAMENYETREQFLARPKPHGLDEQTAWELVSFLRRIVGFPRFRDEELLGEHLGSENNFCTIPPQANRALYAIATRTSSHSQLWHGLRPLQKRSALIRPIVEDLHVASIRDGLSLGYEDVRRLLIDRDEPRNDDERLISRMCAILESGVSGETPTTLQSLSAIYRQLTEGLDELPKRRRHADGPLNWVEKDGEGNVTERLPLLDKALAWGTHPLFGMIIQSETFWVKHPFPACNSLLEMAARWLTAQATDMPALRLVPFSKLRYDWEQGLLTGESGEPFPYGRAVVQSSFGIDSTPYFLQMLDLISAELDRLTTIVETIGAEDARLKDLVASDWRLNHRQQELLGAMIDDPALVVDVARFKERFGVVTSTAREDLSQLAALHYCSTDYEGRKQIFWRNPRWGTASAPCRM